MKQKTKKLLTISLGLVSVAAIFSWYFFPVLMGKWFLYNTNNLGPYLNVRPGYIDNLPTPPMEWDRISIDTMLLKLPMGRYSKISANYNYLSLISDQGSIVISDLVPIAELLETIEMNSLEYPLVSYEDRTDILKVLPADISFLNSRNQNKGALNNLILKAIGIPASGITEVLFVDPRLLKAICIMSEEREQGLSATLELYNQDENMKVFVMLMNYKNRVVLNSDLLSFLGGIRLPNEPLDPVRSKNDITAIIRRYKPTEHHNSPGQLQPMDSAAR